MPTPVSWIITTANFANGFRVSVIFPGEFVYLMALSNKFMNWTVRSSEGVKEKMDSQAQRDWECPKLANNQYR